MELAQRGVFTKLACPIRGSGKIVEACKKYISSKEGHLSEDKKSSWIEVECLGACVNAPMIQINEDYYEDLDAISAEKIFKSFKDDSLPKLGSQKGRKGSEPIKQRLTLLKN